MGLDINGDEMYDMPYEGEGEECFIFDPTTRSFRVLVLLGCCFLTFGSYYTSDLPGAIGADELSRFFNVPETVYCLLYSFGALPNIVMPLLGGFFIDKYLGPRWGGVVFSGLVFAGQLLVAIGALQPNAYGFSLAVIGRFVYGLGVENLSVVQSTYISKWFRGKPLTTGFAIALSISRVSAALNLVITPSIASISINMAMWVALLTCAISVAAACYLSLFDWKAEAIVKPGEDEPEIAFPRFSDVRELPGSVWYLACITLFYYISVFVWVQYAVDFLQEYYDVSPMLGGPYISIPYWIAAVLCPVFRQLQQRLGFSLLFLIFATGLNGLVMLELLLAPPAIPPYVPLAFLGLSYAIAASALWPLVPLLVQQEQLGLAFGLIFAVQNAGLTVAPIIVGFVSRDHQFGYSTTTFAWCAAVSCLLALSLLLVDAIQGRRLNLSAREVRDREQLAALAHEEYDLPQDQDYLVRSDSLSVVDIREKRNSRSSFY